MARYRGAKNRLARAHGSDLGLKTVGSKAHASLLRRINITPGQHGAKRKKTPSNYSLQLREKQKAKRIYGILERQFRKYFTQAAKKKGNRGEALLQLLETRLDNVVYRLGLAPTRSAARQFVGHRHILVNGKVVNIPSYKVCVDDVITLRPKALKIPAVLKLLQEKNPMIPQWLDRQKSAGKLVSVPERSEIELDINEQLIVEYYSR